MQPHKHNYIFRERDIDRLINQYGNKPKRETKEKLMNNLKAEREKFRRLGEFRSKGRAQSWGIVK